MTTATFLKEVFSTLDYRAALADLDPKERGGRYEVTCPQCGRREAFIYRGSDRIQCNRRNQCGANVSVWDHVKERDGLSQAATLARLAEYAGMSLPKGDRPSFRDDPDLARARRRDAADVWTPDPARAQAEAWMDAARELADECNLYLASGATDADAVLRWLETKRGISRRTALAMGLGFNSGWKTFRRDAWGLPTDESGRDVIRLCPSLTIPVYRGGGIVRIRYRRTNAEMERLKRRYPGGDHARYLMLPGGDGKAPLCLCNEYTTVAVIVESELDAILVWEKTRPLVRRGAANVGAVAMGSADVRPDADLDAGLRRVELILCAMDADAAGAKSAWKWWAANYPNCVRWPSVGGCKDPGEMFEKGLSLADWIYTGLVKHGRAGRA